MKVNPPDVSEIVESYVAPRDSKLHVDEPGHTWARNRRKTPMKAGTTRSCRDADELRCKKLRRVWEVGMMVGA